MVEVQGDRAQKRFSTLSLEALSNLGNTDTELKRIEGRVSDLTHWLHGYQSSAAQLAEVRTELALLESQAKQLEVKGVDDVYTGELHSGKQEAKDQKKDMLRRLEVLFTSFEQVFALIPKATT